MKVRLSKHSTADSMGKVENWENFAAAAKEESLKYKQPKRGVDIYE